MSGGRITEEYSQLVNPGVRIPRNIEGFTGISNEMVADAPPFEQLAGDIMQRLSGRLFVAHNARFDYGFLRNEFRRVEHRLRVPVLCTVKLSRRLEPEVRGHSLDAVMERYGIGCAARHRALGDARVLADLLQLLRSRRGLSELDELVADLVREAPLPPQLDPGLADELPDGPGVYRFWGEGDALLYVGKSTSLRTRVLSHFAGDHRSSKELKLSRQVRRIDWVETAGELGALLKEARWVKQLAPLHNRRLRGGESAYTIRLEPAGEGIRMRVEPLEALAQPSSQAVAAEQCERYGVFRSEKDAAKAMLGLVRENRLCAKVLGLEPGQGSCFGHQVGRCRGVCVGAEPEALHAARARLALTPHKLREWPFRGRIGIRERDWRGLEEVHVFHDWAYVGTATSDDELAELSASGGADFDLDCYRILGRYLDRPAPRARIVELD